jgi:hypothetical protein
MLSFYLVILLLQLIIENFSTTVNSTKLINIDHPLSGRVKGFEQRKNADVSAIRAIISQNEYPYISISRSASLILA